MLGKAELKLKIIQKKIAEETGKLRGLFTEDALCDFSDDEDIAWKLFVDGCSALQVLKKAVHEYAAKNLDTKTGQLLLVRPDLLLLENQISQSSWAVERQDKNGLNLTIQKFLLLHDLLLLCKDLGKEGSNLPEHRAQIDPSPSHLLDVLHTTILSKDCGITLAGKKLPSLRKLMSDDSDQRC